MSVKKQSPKRKVNLLRLCESLNKLVKDAVDKEVAKRFKTVIDSCEVDITKTDLLNIMRHYEKVDADSYGEILQPYVKHYIFMMRRDNE
jgi:hypothetical protein